MQVSEVEAKAVYNATLQLSTGIFEYFLKQKSPINEMIFVPMSILSRILRTHDAITLLLKNGHYSEAAVLVLTQFELRFDLGHVCSDIKNATAWVEHENPRAMSIGMKAKLDKLFRPADAARLYETYGYLSGIKHGNPLYSELAFPGRGRAGRIVIATGPIEDKFAKVFSDALFAYSTYQVAWSAQVLSKFISKYAVMDHERRLRAHENYIRLRHLESDLRRFLKRKVSARKTFFGIKSLLSGKQQPAAETKNGKAIMKTGARNAPSHPIDAKIAELGGWRGEMLARVRAVISAADPGIVETLKWQKPSNPAGVPVWEHNGIICTGETYKDKVKLTFDKGAALDDPKGLFNSSPDGNRRRAIDIFEGDEVDEEALAGLVRAAVALNGEKKRK